MYIYVYMCIYIYKWYIYIHTYIYIYVYTYIYIHMYIYIYLCAYTRTYIYIYIYMCMCVCVCIQQNSNMDASPPTLCIGCYTQLNVSSGDWSYSSVCCNICDSSTTRNASRATTSNLVQDGMPRNNRIVRVAVEGNNVFLTIVWVSVNLVPDFEVYLHQALSLPSNDSR